MNHQPSTSGECSQYAMQNFISLTNIDGLIILALSLSILLLFLLPSLSLLLPILVVGMILKLLVAIPVVPAQ